MNKKSDKKEKIIKWLILVIIVAVGITLYVINSNKKEGLRITTWDNIYNENNVNMFYDDKDSVNNSKKLSSLNSNYKIKDYVASAKNEKEKALKTMELLKEIVEYDDVPDSISTDGYGILQEKGASKKVSDRDMAYIARDFLKVAGFYSRFGEFRKAEPQFEENPSYYVVEFWSETNNKWIMIDFKDEGYFEKADMPLSAMDVISENINKLVYIGNDTQSNYRKNLHKYMSSYTVAIDNTVKMDNSNSYITYCSSEKDIDLMKSNSYLGATIFTTSDVMINRKPKEEVHEKDNKAYLILMKKPLKEQGDFTYVVGAFKDGAIIKEAYINANNEGFKLVDGYLDVELQDGKNEIQLSLDGHTVISKIVIEKDK